MSEILKIQQSFLSAVLNETGAGDLSFISSDAAEERFSVYRQTIFMNMRSALQITFPGVWKLLGDECADSAAHLFYATEERLPISGCLDDFGADFPEFLASLSELASVPYIADYARYEWLKHLAYGATGANPVSANDLQNITEEQIEGARFELVPSCHLITSKYPLHDIHEIAFNLNAAPIKISANPSYGVITRLHSETCTFWVTREVWEFVNQLSNGFTLLQSAEYSQSIDADFDLTAALVFLMQKELIQRVLL